MYVITGGGRDRQGSPGAEVVVATCQSCGYWEEHVTDPALVKVEKKCDWSRR